MDLGMRRILVAVTLGMLSFGLFAAQGAGQAPATPAPTTPADSLPEGPGKKIVQRMCTGCHNLKTVTAKRATHDEWASTVDLMVSRGADGSDADVDAVVKYLSKNFGPEKTPPAAPPQQ
jgi:mono/diheme cytochrome c family protein